MSGRLIGPKTWNRNVKILGPCEQSVTVCVDFLGALDHNLFNKLCWGCMRSEMAIDFEFTKWNRCWVSELSVDSPLFYFGTVKNSFGFVQIGPKLSMCCVHELCVNFV